MAFGLDCRSWHRRLPLAAALGLFFSYIPGMIGASFRSESFGSGPRSAGVTGAEGNPDAELAETILADSGMEDGPGWCWFCLFSVLRTSIQGVEAFADGLWMHCLT